MRDLAINLAREAGGYLLRNFRSDETLQKERGLSKEIVTKYDYGSDKIIVDSLTKAFPKHNILTEESGLTDRKGEYLWICDSLDGTGNYANGNPYFSVSIALMHKGDLLVAVVFAPFLDELYVAERGEGATMNGHRIHVSSVQDMARAYVVSCEGGSKDNVRMSQLFQSVYPIVKDMRKIGSAAIEGASVACGRADAFITFDISPWDVAAAVLLVEEAGGRVSDFLGNPWQPQKSDVLMTNGPLHSILLQKLKGPGFM